MKLRADYTGRKGTEDHLELQSSRDKDESLVAVAVADPPTFRRVLLLVVLERGERVGLDRLGGCHGRFCEGRQNTRARRMR